MVFRLKVGQDKILRINSKSASEFGMFCAHFVVPTVDAFVRTENTSGISYKFCLSLYLIFLALCSKLISFRIK